MKILVMSCDKNFDLFEPYHYCIEKYWPTHPEVIYCTESITNPYYKTICANKATWGERVKEATANIDDEFILLTLDDIFIREPIPQETVNNLEAILVNNPSVGYINFEGDYQKIIKEFNSTCNIFDAINEEYKISVMINLFRKNCLVN